MHTSRQRGRGSRPNSGRAGGRGYAGPDADPGARISTRDTAFATPATRGRIGYPQGHPSATSGLAGGSDVQSVATARRGYDPAPPSAPRFLAAATEGPLFARASPPQFADPPARRAGKRKSSSEPPGSAESDADIWYGGIATPEESVGVREAVRRDLLRETVSRLAEGQPHQQTLYTVVKNVQTGARGGAYYIGSNGKKIWLKKDQRRKCMNGTLDGTGDTCPRQIKEYKRKERGVDRGDDDRAWWWWE